MKKAAEYIVSNGQSFRTSTGRVFVLNVAGSRISLDNIKTKERFTLIDYYAPDTLRMEFILSLGSIAVGEKIFIAGRKVKFTVKGFLP
jgi:hypothetical protein